MWSAHRLGSYFILGHIRIPESIAKTEKKRFSFWSPFVLWWSCRFHLCIRSRNRGVGGVGSISVRLRANWIGQRLIALFHSTGLQWRIVASHRVSLTSHWVFRAWIGTTAKDNRQMRNRSKAKQKTNVNTECEQMNIINIFYSWSKFFLFTKIIAQFEIQ